MLSLMNRKMHGALRRLRRLLIPAKPLYRHPVFVDIHQELTGLGDDAGTVQSLLQGLEQEGRLLDRHDTLVHLLGHHPRPHLANYLLALHNYRHGIDEVKSYPPHLWMDISNVCSVECRFCKYTHDHLKTEHVRLEQVKALDWLRYVRLLNLTAGTAEAITNPQFFSIFDYVRDTYPHLHITFLTNGRTLNEKYIRAIAGRLDQLHVSMNASCEESYNHIIASGSWAQFSRNMKLMGEIFKGHDRPKVTASFVIMKSNLHRVHQHLDFAVKHGASVVLFHHYYPHYVADLHNGDTEVLQVKFGHHESLYHHQQECDEVFSSLRERAKGLGVEVHIPPPFTTGTSHLAWGARSYTPAEADCTDPWMKLYLLWGFKSRRQEVTICCGLAADLGVYFDRDEIATSAGLFKVWNAPTLQAYRRTVNGNRINPICAMCRKVDRFAPDAVYPNQKSFFNFNGLPVPPHFNEGAEQPLQQLSLIRKASA